jgi:hypothetical protein
MISCEAFRIRINHANWNAVHAPVDENSDLDFKKQQLSDMACLAVQKTHLGLVVPVRERAGIKGAPVRGVLSTGTAHEGSKGTHDHSEGRHQQCSFAAKQRIGSTQT